MPPVTATRTGPETISLLTPRVEPGSSVSARSGQRRPSVVIPRRGPAERDQREHGAGRAGQRHALAGVDGDRAGGADAGVEAQRREARRREQDELGEVVIEAGAAPAADDGDAVGADARARSRARARGRSPPCRPDGARCARRRPRRRARPRASPSRGRRRARRRVSPSDAACSSPESAAITNAPAGSGADLARRPARGRRSRR